MPLRGGFLTPNSNPPADQTEVWIERVARIRANSQNS
jgi:hypothetical protein